MPLIKYILIPPFRKEIRLITKLFNYGHPKKVLKKKEKRKKLLNYSESFKTGNKYF